MTLDIKDLTNIKSDALKEIEEEQLAELTDFNYFVIPPELYDDYNVPAYVRKDPALIPHFCTFVYKGLRGYLKPVFTETFISDTQIDKEKWMKKHCLEWCQEKYPPKSLKEEKADE